MTGGPSAAISMLPSSSQSSSRSGREYVRETNLVQIDVDTGQTRQPAQQMALAEDVLPYAYPPVITVIAER